MRPVNLIPPEERPGGHKPLRSGPLAYIVVGALAAAVIAITALVLTENEVAESKAEVTQLQHEEARITAKAQELSAYTQFASVREQRLATVTSLADSRFDWARILHELALVMPTDVQLTSLSGNAAPGVGGAGAGIGMRSQIAGPALEMVGCASSQPAVADFIESIKSIDGVTRVGVPQSTMSGEGGNATTAGSCGSGPSAQFQLIAAFDAAPVAPVETGEEVAPAPEATADATSESTTETTSGESPSTEESSGEGEAE
ncbi:MAG TPA: PilN domain-containing protein [Solirubrobacterales bacterium]|nr:PilN domain-containing protein [Solirubrobacterales bacterium]